MRIQRTKTEWKEEKIIKKDVMDEEENGQRLCTLAMKQWMFEGGAGATAGGTS